MFLKRRGGIVSEQNIRASGFRKRQSRDVSSDKGMQEKNITLQKGVMLNRYITSGLNRLTVTSSIDNVTMCYI